MAERFIVMGRFSTDFSLGGESVRNTFLVEGLRERGVDVRTVDMSIWPRRLNEVLQDLGRGGASRRGLTILVSSTPEVLVAASPYLVAMKTLFGARICYWVRGYDFIRSLRSTPQLVRVFSLLDQVFAESSGLRDELSLVGLERISVLPNPRPIPSASERAPVFTMKLSRELRLLFLSRMVPTKGIDTLLEAMDLVAARDPGRAPKVEFYGLPGPGGVEVLENQVKDRADVKIHGEIPFGRVPEVMPQYHFLVYPSTDPDDVLPGVLVEALAAGLPVIAADWRYNSEVVKEGVNGFLFKPGDAAALADVLEQVSAMGHREHQELSDRAWQSAAPHSPAAVADILLNAVRR